MRPKIIAGNWKMQATQSFVADFASELQAQLTRQALPDPAPQLMLFPPALYLTQAQAALGGLVNIGAQNSHTEAAGAFTGEIAPEMLADLGIKFVLVGHSERRSLFGESDAVVAQKVAAAIRAGLAPVLCVGETLAQRQAGQAQEVVAQQLDTVLALTGPEWLAGGMIAYEPVWAIGTGETASPAQAQEMHGFIRQKLAPQVIDSEQFYLLYGGSVAPDNAAELFAQPDVDGGLIGGASLTVEKYVAIARAVG